MSKLVITYENGKIKKELHFRNEVFSYTMVPTRFGKEGDAKCIMNQLEDKYGNEDTEMLDAADHIDFGDEDQIEEALQILDEAERIWQP